MASSIESGRPTSSSCGQPEEPFRRGIARDHLAFVVALDLRQRRAVEERFQPVGALARAFHRGTPHGHAMREVAILALELLVQHGSERDEIVALQLHAEIHLEQSVQLARVVDDGEAEEKAEDAGPQVHAVVDEEEVHRRGQRGRDRQRLVRAPYRRVRRHRAARRSR
jgi:hypothetical protein